MIPAVTKTELMFGMNTKKKYRVHSIRQHEKILPILLGIALCSGEKDKSGTEEIAM